MRCPGSKLTSSKGRERAVPGTPSSCPATGMKRVHAYSPPPSSALIGELVGMAAQLAGTAISLDAPLMSAGLDSIGASELSARLGKRLGTELPSMLLFDHPSLRAITESLDVHNGKYSEQKEILTRVVCCGKVPPRTTRALDARAAAESISAMLLDVLGTSVATNLPLMAAGLDSVAATEFSNTLTS